MIATINIGGIEMQKYDTIEKGIKNNDVQSLRNALGNICYISRDFSDGEFDEVVKYVEKHGIKIKDDKLTGKPIISGQKNEFSEEDFARAIFEMKKNFCDERIEDAKTIGRALYGNKKEERAQIKSTEVKSKSLSKEKQRNSNLKGSGNPNFRGHQQKKNNIVLWLMAAVIMILLIMIFLKK